MKHILAAIAGLLLVVSVAGAQGREGIGTVTFTTSCTVEAQAEFTRGLAMLHSFWFDASAPAFTQAVSRDPGCVIAHWGLAMSALSNPFAWPPSPKGLADGAAAIERARTTGAKTPRERDYIAALETFYKDHDTVNHPTRAAAYEKAMEALAAKYPDDREAAVFHALALNATASPADKTYAKQLRAAAILEKVFAEQPNHPGVAHYLIHSYDYPPIAAKGLTAARRYASIAPAAPHALHMPSHIFTRRGYWKESIESNRASAAAGKNDFDRLHAMDYLMYGHLQRAQDQAAARVLADVRAIGKPNVEHFVTAYALAAIPSRLALERARWAEAGALTPQPADFPWSRFPQSEAIVHFARALGNAHRGDAAAARKDVQRLRALQEALAQAKVGYWAQQVEIQTMIGDAWIAKAERHNDEALRLMRAAADLEDATEKHPVTPGALVPARELLGELLLQLKQPAPALREFEASIAKEPGRFRGLAGAAWAAEQAGNRDAARRYYTELLSLASEADSTPPELAQAKAFLAK